MQSKYRPFSGFVLNLRKSERGLVSAYRMEPPVERHFVRRIVACNNNSNYVSNWALMYIITVLYLWLYYIGKGHSFKHWSAMWRALPDSEKQRFREEALARKNTLTIKNDAERHAAIHACLKLIHKQVYWN